MATLDDLYTPSQKQTSLSLDSLYEQPTKTGVNEAPRSPGAQFMVEGALPMVGMAAGGAGGVALKTALQAKRLMPFLMGGEMAGSAGGEAINQAVGITPPSGLGVAASAVAPVLGRTVAAGLQHGWRLLPGSSAAIQQGAIAEGRKIPDFIKPPDVDALYAQVRSAGNPRMDFPRTSAELQRLATDKREVLPGFENDELLGRLVKARDAIQPQAPTTRPSTILGANGQPAGQVQVSPGTPGGMTFNQFQQTMESLGKQIGSAGDAERRGALKSVYRAMMTDVESMPTPPGTPLNLWKDAKAGYRKKMAQTDLADTIDSSIRTVSEQGVQSFNPNKVINWIDKNPDFQKSISPGELKQIKDTLLKLTSATPTIRNKGGEAATGSGKLLAPLVAGTALGGPVGALAALGASNLIAEAVMSPPGRKLLLKVLTASHGRWGQEQAAMLSAGLAGALQ